MTSTAAPPDRKKLLHADSWQWALARAYRPRSRSGQRFKFPSDCRDAIAASAVLLRGWDYPHVPIRNDEFHCQAPVQDGWEGIVDWDRHRELWRLTRSGQFIHYLALWEDLAPEFRGQRVLGASGVVYSLLEFVEFSRRLTGAASYGTSIDLEIDLVGVKSRELKMIEPGRKLDREVHNGGEYSGVAHHPSFTSWAV